MLITSRPARLLGVQDQKSVLGSTVWLQFLKAVSEGLVLHLLEGSELQRTSTRVVCRELLSGVVLRPLMMWCTPYYANKVWAMPGLKKQLMGGVGWVPCSFKAAGRRTPDSCRCNGAAASVPCACSCSGMTPEQSHVVHLARRLVSSPGSFMLGFKYA